MITENQRSFIKLVIRTPDAGEGWRNVSKVLEKIVAMMVEETPDLYEVAFDEGQMKIRLSEEGKVVGKHLVASGEV